MTWNEFIIRQFAFERMRKFELFKVREIAWASTIAPHLNPKRLPKTKEQFMPLETKDTSVSDKMKERMRKAIEQYKRDLNGSR